VAGSSGQLAQLAFAYDDVLNLDTLTDLHGLHDFGYDGLNRLTQATHPGGSGLPANESFTHTAVGDRKDAAAPSAWTFDANHRITASPGLTYGFDADGNLSTRSDSMTLTHDARQRLVQLIKSGTTSSYLHDPFGRRIRKTVGTQTSWYLWDGSRLVGEYDAAGTRTKRYAYLTDEHAPTQVQDANGTYYVHADHIGTPRLLTNGSAQVVWRASYQAYGSAVVDADPDANSVSVELNLRFPGQHFDAESGLHYNFFRDYDPAAGRYVQTDPIGLAAGPNTFAYVSANPTSSIDPLGLDGSCCNNDYINCLADCIRYLDPFTVMQKVLLTGAGGTFPKSWAGLPRGMGGASPLTTVPSATAHGLGGGGAGTAGGAARAVGRFFSPIWITYGVTMFAVEVYCATVCAKDKCAY
jgi:RHS repeat-associated protein